MKNTILWFGLSAMLLSFGWLMGCEMNKVGSAPEIITLRQSLTGTAVSIEVTRGENYSTRMQAGPLVFHVLPQVVIWAEDENGKLIDTLYVAGADYKQMRHAAKNEKGTKFYEVSVPVWAERMKAAGRKLPSKEQPFPDAITSATPTAGFLLNTKLPLAAPFTLFLEINQAGDENAIYDKQANDWAGQPSLIYGVHIDKTAPGSEYMMTLLGHGGTIGEKPSIHPDVSTLDSALKQVKSIKVTF